LTLRRKIIWGIIAGIAAGMIMGGVGFTLHEVGLMPISGMELNASMILSPELMETPWVFPAGMLVHIGFSAFFALVFVFLAPLFHYRRSVLWGLVYGGAIFVINAGIMAPVMGLHGPFWQMSLNGLLSSLAARLVYGGFVGYFANRWIFSKIV